MDHGGVVQGGLVEGDVALVYKVVFVLVLFNEFQPLQLLLPLYSCTQYLEVSIPSILASDFWDHQGHSLHSVAGSQDLVLFLKLSLELLGQLVSVLVLMREVESHLEATLFVDLIKLFQKVSKGFPKLLVA